MTNENALFEYRRWDQSPSFEGKTLCTGVFRDGQRQVFLGVVPSEAVSATSVELGTVEFRVVSQQPVSLTEDDFALVTADIVEATSQRVLQMPLSGNAGRVMTLEPPTYHNELAQNYPNPFNPSTTIAFSIEKTEQVRLELVDVRGAMIRVLVNERLAEGNHRVQWDGGDGTGKKVASGVYFCRMRTGSFGRTIKMPLLQ